MSIHPTAIVDSTAELAAVEIGPYAVVGPGVTLHDGVVVGPHAVIYGESVLGEGCHVHAHAVIGGDPQDLKYAGGPTRLEIGPRNVFREFVTVNRGTEHGGGVTVIGSDNLFMACSHVGHDARIGKDCVFANSVALAGHVVVEDNVVLGGMAGVHQHSRIGRFAMLGAGAMAAQDVPPFSIAQGDRARLFGLNIIGLRRGGFEGETISALRSAFRELFSKGAPLRIAMERVREGHGSIAEVQELVAFIESSQRGLCRSAGPEMPTG
jgi:UDP-N-acetylglucosamine acyltransferase